MIPAMVRPFPTPAPSPMRKPARVLSGKRCSCCCDAYVIDSSCNADKAPVRIDSSGIETLYQTSVGSTLDNDAVSTTGSGCFRPSLTVKHYINYLMSKYVEIIRQYDLLSEHTFGGHVISICFCNTHIFVIYLFFFW